MGTKPNKKLIKALVGLATTGTVAVGAYKYYYNVSVSTFLILIFKINSLLIV